MRVRPGVQAAMVSVCQKLPLRRSNHGEQAMSRFTDELRNLDGMRDSDELLPAAAVIIDEMETALRRLCDMPASYVDAEIRIRCDTHSDAIDRMRQGRAALAMLEELSK